jgi:spermidine synthase
MPKFELSFLEKPTELQKRQILGIYHKQGWWPESITDPDRVQRVISGSHCFLVVSSENDIVGFGRALSDRTGDAYIHDVTVKEGFRHLGIGSRIVSTLVARLKEDGITWIALIAENSSQAFYKNLDFTAMEKAQPMFRWLI